MTLAIFGLSLLLMLTRPRRLHEAWATVGGAALMLLCARETPSQAWNTIAQGLDVLLFLLGLLLFSELLRASGFFDWAAIHAARQAGGSGARLFRNVFLLGFATTALLSLDTTAVILTPVVLSCVERLRLDARPFLLACAFVANTGSLLLPVSNLTNLLFVNALHWSFIAFAVRMALPQIAVLLVNYMLLKRTRETFDTSLPEAASVLSDVPFFRGAMVVLGLVLVGYFIGTLAGVPPYWVALGGSLLLFAWGSWRHQVDWRIAKHISWPLFPFVAGLFVLVRGVQNIAPPLVFVGATPLATILSAAFTTGLGSNLINNIPMALLAAGAVRRSPLATQYGALLGCNLGPNLTVAGSLATMLVITSARRHGTEVSARDFFAAGLRITPVLLLVAGLALWLTFQHHEPGQVGGHEQGSDQGRQVGASIGTIHDTRIA